MPRNFPHFRDFSAIILDKVRKILTIVSSWIDPMIAAVWFDYSLIHVSLQLHADESLQFLLRPLTNLDISSWSQRVDELIS